jgi:hypothetical protein
MRSFIICTLLSNVIRLIKSRRVRWSGHVACMGEKRNACRILEGKLEGKGPDAGGVIMLSHVWSLDMSLDW